MPIENWLRPLLSQLDVKPRLSPRQGHRCHSSRVEVPVRSSLKNGLFFFTFTRNLIPGQAFWFVLALLLALGRPWNQTPEGYNKNDANRVTDRIFGDQNPNSPRQD